MTNHEESSDRNSDSFFPPSRPIQERPTDRERETEQRPVQRDARVGRFPNELGVPVSLPEMVAVKESIGVALDTFFMHDAGFFCELRIVRRDPIRGDAGPRSGFTVHPDGIRAGSELWRLGLEFPDGRRGFTADEHLIDFEGDFGIIYQGGGGDAALQRHKFYVSAVPNAGKLRIFVDLSSGGEFLIEGDCMALTGASQTASPLW